MKKSTIIYLLMFVCSFLLPSFSIPQTDTIKVNDSKSMRTSSDSVVVSLKFQNPTVEITDSRASGVLEKKFDSQATSTVELMNAVNLLAKDLGQAVVLQQEGRCESGMDRIKRITGYTEENINAILFKQRLINLCYCIITIVYLIATIVIYNTSFRRQKLLTILPITLCTINWLVVMSLNTYLLPRLYGVEYMYFFQLLKLSP
jgi:hypothetical protein